jgi:hypothetical protein
MAKSSVPRQPQNIRRPVEKSPQDQCIGSVPFDYSILEDGGCASDTGSDVPKENLKEEVMPYDAGIRLHVNQESLPDGARGITCSHGHGPGDFSLKQEPLPLTTGVQEQETNAKSVINAENKLTPILAENATPIPGCKGLLNRKEVRLTALRLINERFPSQRGKLFSRVSDKFIDRLELAVQTEMLAAINRHPSPMVSPTVNQSPWTQKIIPNSNTPPTVPPP